MQKTEIIKDTLQVKDIDLRLDSTIVIASRRNSGKSILAREIVCKLLHQYDIYFIVMVSNTAVHTTDWSFVDQSLIYKDDAMDEAIEKVFDYQIKKQNIRKNPKGKHGLIILDDITITKNTMSKQLSDVFTLGRHFLLTIIVLVQYPRYILNSTIRNNIDYLFVSELTFQGVQAIYETINTNKTVKQFREFLDQNNHDFRYLFYDNVTKDKNNRIKFIKANLLNIEIKN